MDEEVAEKLDFLFETRDRHPSGAKALLNSLALYRAQMPGLPPE
jgi:hypothetical protein